MPTSPSQSQHPAREGMRATILGIALNLVLAVIKAVSGIVGNSYALIADAIESLTDVATSLIVFFGLRYASRPPDDNHPYGHGKAEPLAAAVVAGSLVLAAFAIGIQSVKEILVPHQAPAPFTLAVVALVLIAKEAIYRYQSRMAQRLGSSAIHTDAWHHRSDAITSLAVFIGISVALIGGKGWESADDWSALFAALFIVVNAWRLLRPALGELTDEAPAPEMREQVRVIAEEVSGVQGVEKCFVRKSGFEHYVDLHVMVSGELSVRQGHDIAHAVKDAIRASDTRITDVLVHIEPVD